MKKKVSIIDYGMGNVQSLKNIFDILNCDTRVTSNEEIINKSDAIILPGVGAFKRAMYQIKKKKLDKVIYKQVNKNKPILGICLGMQLFFEKSYEFGITSGLKLIDGKVDKLSYSKTFKLPHIGWNEINTNKINAKKNIIKNIRKKNCFYFVHSFHCMPKFQKNVIATSSYDTQKFCSVVAKNKIYGCQFHPEKSGKTGKIFLINFLEEI